MFLKICLLESSEFCIPLKMGTDTGFTSALWIVVQLSFRVSAVDNFIVNITCKNETVLKVFQMMRPTFLLYDEKYEKETNSVSYICDRKPFLLKELLKSFEKGLKLAQCKMEKNCLPFVHFPGHPVRINDKDMDFLYPRKIKPLCVFHLKCKQDENGLPNWIIEKTDSPNLSHLCKLMEITRRSGLMLFNRKMFHQANMKSIRRTAILTKKQRKEAWPKIFLYFLIAGTVVQTFGYLYFVFLRKDADGGMLTGVKKTESEAASTPLAETEEEEIQPKEAT